MDAVNLNSSPVFNPMKLHPGLIIGAVAILIALGVGIWWLLRPSYDVLLSNLPEETRAEVLATLMQQQVPYQLEDGTGNILVPDDQIAQLRAQLSDQGLPAKQAVGLELFSQGDYGMSEFAQRINYQRALEGELARTIQTIDEVRHARVHITLGKTSIFENRKEAAKASVVLQLKPEKSLNPGQVSGVQQLVAAAVPGLTPDQVVVLDDMGRSLSSVDGAAGGDRWYAVRQMEQDYEARVRKLLVGALPDADFQLSVKLQVNFDKVKSIKEEILPAKGQQGGYLLKRREQVSSGQTGSSQSIAGTQNNNNAETEYVFGRERAEIERAVGSVERVNVAVVASQSLTPETIELLKTILNSGLGLVPARGDSIAILGVASTLSISATPNEAVIEPNAVTHQAPAAELSSITASKYLLGLLFLITVVFGVVLLRLRSRKAVAPAKALTQAERDQLLQQVRLWLAHDMAR